MRTRYRVLIHVGIHLTVVAVILLAAAAPLLIAGHASHFAEQHGCQLDEGGPHPCVVDGHDHGPELYRQFLTAWNSIYTLPAGSIVVALYAMVISIVYNVAGIRRRQDPAPPTPPAP
jgi:hypothetical protein